jgi:DnaJ-class molecular chaperone
MVQLLNDYQILGITQPTTKDAVVSAYRKLAHQHHPDKGGDPKKFSDLTAARDRILKDLDKPPVQSEWQPPSGTHEPPRQYRDFHFERTQTSERTKAKMDSFKQTLNAMVQQQWDAARSQLMRLHAQQLQDLDDMYKRKMM